MQGSTSRLPGLGAIRAFAAAAFLLGALSPGAAAAQTLFDDGFESPADWPENDAAAARFLAQATFGPTLAQIARLRQIGYPAWLDEQFAAPVSTQVPYLNWVTAQPEQPDGNSVTDGTRLEIWTINALGTPDPSRGHALPTDQLRQRVAFAWSQVFVVSALNGTLIYEPWALADWNDMLAENAFGNYRDLLREVTLHGAMGVYLSHIQNRKQDLALNVRPDENYAREVMQLFSIGLVQLNPDGTVRDGDPATPGVQPVPTYDQATVRGFAAVFTGWNWNNTGCGVNGHVCCTVASYGNCGPIGEASHLSSTLPVALAKGVLSTVLICTPLALRSATSLSSLSLDSLRCSAVASTAASISTLRSASDRRSQLRLLISSGVISYLWPVSEMNLFTS